MIKTVIATNQDKVDAHSEINRLAVDGDHFYELTLKQVKRTRTSLQNRAMHKYFDLLGSELNAAGYDMRKFLDPGIDIPWNAGTIKDNVWRPVQRAVVHKESTAKLKTHEVNEVYNVLSRHISQNYGIYVPFPSWR